MDRDWTVDFVRVFQVHQVERIRRAILAYRDKHDLGDVRLTKELLKHLPQNVTYDSTLKNVQRLRGGQPIRGTVFLNACVQFLEVQMVTPPEEELGLALKHFVGNVFGGYADLWNNVAGDYVLRVLGEGSFHAAGQIGKPVTAIAVRSRRKQPQSQDSFVVLSITPGEGMDYGIARERYFIPHKDGSADEDTAYSEANALNRKGLCLPVGRQDFLIMMRDCMFSHMYVLRREIFGFGGTIIIPSAFSLFSPDVIQLMSQSQYAVALHRVARE